MFDKDVYSVLIDNIPAIEEFFKQAGCKQITSNKEGTYKPVNLGIRSYYSVTYGTLKNFNNDPKNSVRLLLGVSRGSIQKTFIVIKKADLGNLPIRGYTNISNFFTHKNYMVEITKDSDISTIGEKIIETIYKIREEIENEYKAKELGDLSFISSTNNLFKQTIDKVKEGLIGIGCEDITTDNSKYRELTKDNKGSEISFGFETPSSHLYMDLTLSVQLYDYSITERKCNINAIIHFSPIWIMDGNQITRDNIDSLKEELKSYSCSVLIQKESDLEKGVADIITRVKSLDNAAKKNLDLFDQTDSGNLSVHTPDVKSLSNVLSNLPNLFVKALQKNDVTELDKGEKAYYNNLNKIKKEYDSDNYSNLEDLYNMFKFAYSEISRKLSNLQGKKGIRDQYNALFNLSFYDISQTWEQIVKKFNNYRLSSLRDY